MNKSKPEITLVQDTANYTTRIMIPNKVSGRRQAMADETGHPINFDDEFRAMPLMEARAFMDLMLRRAQFCANL